MSEYSRNFSQFRAVLIVTMSDSAYNPRSAQTNGRMTGLLLLARLALAHAGLAR
jgi:hypothetical protein